MDTDSRWPPLNCLRGFVAAARYNNFSAAAEALHLTQSAVSHQIKTLESWLGQPLFIRHQRRVQLTDAGSDLLHTAETCLAGLDKGLRRLEQYKKPNQFIVFTGADFASGWLISRLAQFRQHCPRVDVWLYTSDGTPELDIAEVHCAILQGSGDWRDVDAQHLLDDEQLPLCAPDHPLLTRRERQPLDLLDYQLLHDEDEITWGDWFRAVGFAQVNPVEGANFSSQNLMLQAAELGQGIALGSRLVAADRIADGRLVAAMPQSLNSGRGVYLLRHEDGLRSDYLEAFGNWLRETCEAEAGQTDQTG